MPEHEVWSIRRQLWASGYWPIAVYGPESKVNAPGKQPVGKNWQVRLEGAEPSVVTEPPAVNAFNTGILCNGLRAIDVDIDDREIVEKVKALASTILGGAPIRYRSDSAHCLMLFRAAVGEPCKLVISGTTGKVEVLGRGQQFVAFGIHPKGNSFQWEPHEFAQYDYNQLNPVTEEAVDEFLKAVAPLIDAHVPPMIGDRIIKGEDRELDVTQSATAHERAYAIKALKEIVVELGSKLPGSGRNTALNGTAYRMGRMVGAGWIEKGDIESALCEASRQNGYEAKDGLDAVKTTIHSGLNAGAERPHPPLPKPDILESVLNFIGEGKAHFDSQIKQASPAKIAATGLLNERDCELPNVELVGQPMIADARNNRVTTIETPRPLRREAPPPTRFPIDELGDTLAGAARAIIDKIQCADAIAAMSVLGAASLAVQAHADVVIPATNHIKPLSLFLVTVAASGERKSAADTEALLPIRQFEKELYINFNAEFPAYQNRMDAWEAERERIKRSKTFDMDSKGMQLAALGVAPSRPLTPMLTCPEPTFEGLCKLYVDGMPMLGIFSDEGGQFVGGHGLNAENQLRTITGLSALWDGSAIKRVRVTDGISVLPGRRLALHLMMQPDVAAGLLSNPVLKDQGFLSRILVAAPNSTAGTRFQRRAPYEQSAVLNGYSSRLLEVLRQKPQLAMGKRNELEPRALGLDVEAVPIWMDYSDAVERRMSKDGAFEQIKGFANKLPEHAMRIAGVLTLIDDINARVISADVLRRAIIIAEYFASEALRLFDSGMISPTIHLAQLLLEWIENKWSEPFIGLKVIYQSGPSTIREAEKAKRIVAILVDHGWLASAPPGTKVAGVAVKEAWRVIRPPQAMGLATPATLLLTQGRVAE